MSNEFVAFNTNKMEVVEDVEFAIVAKIKFLACQLAYQEKLL